MISKKIPNAYILSGDYNGHSPLWGSDYTNNRGVVIEELMNNYNLVPLNTS